MKDHEIPNQKIEIVKENEIFTNSEASKFLRTSTVTLWRERKAGRISFHRVASTIVYTRQDLENYLTRNKREAFAITKIKQE